MKASEERKFIELVIRRLKKKYSDQMHTKLKYSNTWELLIAVILSAKTKDDSVNLVTPKFFKDFPNPEKLIGKEEKDIYPYFQSLGLYREKSKRIVKMANILVNDFDSKVPNNLDGLMKLPGVGRKVANVVLSEGFKINEGIAIDTHCIVVSNRLGLVSTKDPAKIEKHLIKLVPKKDWNNISHLFIALGRDVCQSRKKICDRCILNDVCVSSDVKKPLKSKFKIKNKDKVKV